MTNPRDKIFALLGLCHDGTTFVPLPNYNQPLEVVINDIVRTIMRVNRLLDLMCLKETSHPSKLDLPSWVPDLTSLWSGSMTIQETTFDQWQSTYNFNPVLEASDSRTLKVKGKILGTVAQLSTGMSPDGTFDLPDASRNPWISSTSMLDDQNPDLRNASLEAIRMRDQIWAHSPWDFLGKR